MALSEKQKGVLKGAALGAIVSVAGIVAALRGALPQSWCAPPPGGRGARPGAAWAHAAAWDLLLALPLIATIGRMAGFRFFTASAIDGSGFGCHTPAQSKARNSQAARTAAIYQACIQNTLEQLALAVPVHLAWAATMPRAQSSAIPFAALCFLVGRVLFVAGYARGAAARSLGFAMTFYPTVTMVVAMLVSGRLFANA